MIYDFPGPEEPIRQGDIFLKLPRVDISLKKITALDTFGTVETSWNKIFERTDPVNAIVTLKPAAAIVISQDCDASRPNDLTLCEIRDFRDVERKCQETTSPKK